MEYRPSVRIEARADVPSITVKVITATAQTVGSLPVAPRAVSQSRRPTPLAPFRAFPRRGGYVRYVITRTPDFPDARPFRSHALCIADARTPHGKRRTHLLRGRR